MKTIKSVAWLNLTCAMMGVWSPDIRAENGPERVLFKEGEVWAITGDKTVPLPQDVRLPNDIVVSTNGTFKVGAYPPRAFAEGQILGANGMLTSPNGQIEPVIDNVTMLAGRTVSTVNGRNMTLNQDIPLGRDKRLTSDRVLLGNDRSWMRVIDGQLFTPDGKTIPALDTISLQQGKVVVQKEGTQIPVAPGRSIMMNEGTKVLGDGAVVDKNGQMTRLTEGQILTIEGVVKRR